MPLNLNDIYCRREKEKQKFFFKKNDLHFKDSSNKEIKIFQFPDKIEDNDFSVLDIIEYKNYSILFLNWPIFRNIIIFDRIENNVIWQVPRPKAYDKNWWRDYHVFSEQSDVVYCYADRYVAGFKIPSGELVSEQFSDSGDPRDF